MSPAFPLSPPFPSYCCSSIASLYFPSHPSHSPLCPSLPFATHCLLLYFLFLISFPSLHLRTDFFPGENILLRLCLKKAIVKELTLTTFSSLKHSRVNQSSKEAGCTRRIQPAQKNVFPGVFPLGGPEVLGLYQLHRFCHEFQRLALGWSFCLSVRTC